MADLDSDSSPNVLWFCNRVAWVVPAFIVALPGIIPTRADAAAQRPPPSAPLH